MIKTSHPVFTGLTWQLDFSGCISSAPPGARFRISCAGRLVRNAIAAAIMTALVWPVTLRCPLVSVATAAVTLGQSHRAVSALIESGQLLYAFNLATSAATKAEVRILSESLANYQHHRPVTLAAAADLSRVLGLIFPRVATPRAGVVPTIRAVEAAHQMAVTTDHIFNLVAAKEIKLVRHTRRSRGRGLSPLIDFPSLTTFLARRRIA